MSQRSLEPYHDTTISRFFFEKDNLVLIISIESNNCLFIESFISRGYITLNWDKTKAFCEDIRKIVKFPQTPIELLNIDTNKVGLFIRRTFAIVFDTDSKERDSFDEINDIIIELEEIEKLLHSYREFDLYSESLEEIYKNVKKETDKQKKGKLLEKMIQYLIDNDPSFKIYKINVNTESEEIDIIIENQRIDSFFAQLQSPFILVECRNWTSKIRAKDIRDFAQKIQNRPSIMCKIGCIVTTSSLTRKANSELIGYRGKEFVICTIENTDLELMIKKKERFSKVLSDKIKEASLR